MKPPPPLSVVMPVHDAMPFVEAGVRSILDQSFRDFELVIGDDGSSDGTSEVLHRLAATDDRVRLLRRDRKSGLAGAGNWVVSEARAPIVAIAHADDVLAPCRLECQLQLLAARPDAVMVGSVYQGIDYTGSVVHPPNLWRLISPSPFASFAHSSVMFRRHAFHQAGGYRKEADYWEDLDLYWRMAELGRVFVIPEALLNYRHSLVSARTRDQASRVEDALDLMYRSAELYWRHEDREPLLLGGGRHRRIHPRIFVARSWTRLWSGQRSDVFAAMIRRASFRVDLMCLATVMFVTWATISPKSLRLVLQTVTRVRNVLARRIIADATNLEWRPRKPLAPIACDGLEQTGGT